MYCTDEWKILQCKFYPLVMKEYCDEENPKIFYDVPLLGENYTTKVNK